MNRMAVGAAAVAGFVVVLLYTTMISTPARPPTGIAHDAASAEESCVRSVRDSVADARFPFSANAEYLGDARYRLTGIVETAVGVETVRRNYECVVGYSETGTYHADSVKVWQSH